MFDVYYLLLTVGSQSPGQFLRRKRCLRHPWAGRQQRGNVYDVKLNVGLCNLRCKLTDFVLYTLDSEQYVLKPICFLIGTLGTDTSNGRWGLVLNEPLTTFYCYVDCTNVLSWGIEAFWM